MNEVEQEIERGMRVVKVPAAAVTRAAFGPCNGISVSLAVAVDWPELRLTEEQILANVVAQLDGREQPNPDHSIFSVELPFLTSSVVEGDASLRHAQNELLTARRRVRKLGERVREIKRRSAKGKTA